MRAVVEITLLDLGCWKLGFLKWGLVFWDWLQKKWLKKKKKKKKWWVWDWRALKLPREDTFTFCDVSVWLCFFLKKKEKKNTIWSFWNYCHFPIFFHRKIVVKIIFLLGRCIVGLFSF